MLLKPQPSESHAQKRRSSTRPFFNLDQLHSQIIASSVPSFSTKMSLSYILGTNISPTSSANIYVYKKEQLIYYVKNMFVKFNIATKKYAIIYEEGDKVKAEKECEEGKELRQFDRVRQQDTATMGNNFISNSVLVVTKYFATGPTSLFLTMKKIENIYYLSLFWTESGKPATLIRISEDRKQTYINCTYHPKKGYIYLLYKLTQSDPQAPCQQYLKILQLHTLSFSNSSNINSSKSSRSLFTSQNSCTSKSNGIKYKILLNCLIRRSGGRFQELTDVIVGEDHTQLYIFGIDYFRHWTVFFNQKTIKESNYRNIQRNIKKEKIMEVMWVPDIGFNRAQDRNSAQYSESGKMDHYYLVIITAIEVLFVKNNELVHISIIPNQSPFTKTHNDNAELILQQSLNQIYKTKFNVDGAKTDENQDQSELSFNNGKSRYGPDKLTSASKVWIQTAGKADNSSYKHIVQGSKKSQLKIKEKDITVEKEKQKQKQKAQKLIKFCASFDYSNIFIFKICADFSIKIDSSINYYSEYRQLSQPIPKSPALTHVIKNISTSSQGTLILLTDSLHQNYINNRIEDFENTQIDSLYIGGHSHVSSIRSLSCPQIMSYLVSVSEDGVLKVWNKAQKDRFIMIDEKFKLKPVSALMHPCGFFVVVNFGLQIKVFAIVSNELEEIVSVKTHDYCSHIQLCKSNNFLIANQKHTIQIYDPFTLHILARLEPQDLRLEYRKIKCSDDGQYIIFQCCNNKVYRYQTNSIFHQEVKKQFYEPDIKLDEPQLCHRQSEQYTCLYFNFGTAKSNNIMLLEKQNNKPITLSKNNIFIGFTKTKFMVVYSNFGQELVAQFPVVSGVYVTDFCVAHELFFVGTNKGSIFMYKWPILESHFEVVATQQKTPNGSTIGRLKPPKCLQQFKVWRDQSPITSLIKVPNNNELVVGAFDGTIGFVNYNTFKNGIQVFDSQISSKFSSERKKMMQSINNLKLVKIAQTQKIAKLIQKTEHDIQKLEFELQNERERKKRQLQREQEQLKHNSEKRKKIYQMERSEKFVQLQNQLKQQEKQYQAKKMQLRRLMDQFERDCQGKTDYERDRIEGVKNQLQIQKKCHKQRIIKLMQQHKMKIHEAKLKNLSHIRRLQQQFQELIKTKYKQQQNIAQISQIPEGQLSQNQQISIQTIKVQQLKSSINAKKKELQKMEQKVKSIKNEDEEVQKIFERNLQKYNEYRYENLVLHSELLKIQNQLHQRKQILVKKDQIISIAFHQKETNQTFKQFVSGAICGLEDQKAKAYEEYVQKEDNLRMLFDQLTGQINKAENKKLKLVELAQAIKIYQRQKADKEKTIRTSVQQLKDLKKYLLVQGVSQGSQHKKFYQQQQKLLTTIRWLQKRFRMNSINQKKLTILKKSSVKQVINQNKNLLQQCNQLREEGIIYQNQIDHLSKKLAQANQIIEYDQKVRNQSYMIKKQSEKLNQIRGFFRSEAERVGVDGVDEVDGGKYAI